MHRRLLLAATWWQLLLFRFLAALGIGGEWAVGAALLSQTWPRWRPWIAAALQTGVNAGIIVAMIAGNLLADLPCRTVFLVGILPALLVIWIRRAVPSRKSRREARSGRSTRPPGITDLFRGELRRTTLLAMLVCGFSLSGHWAFLFWFLQHLRNLPDLADWTDPEKTRLASQAMIVVIAASVAGNFLVAWIARCWGYRRTIAAACVSYFLLIAAAYGRPLALPRWPRTSCPLAFARACSRCTPCICRRCFPRCCGPPERAFASISAGLLPPAQMVFFGLSSRVGDDRLAILYGGLLFLPAAVLVMGLSEPPDEVNVPSTAQA